MLSEFGFQHKGVSARGASPGEVLMVVLVALVVAFWIVSVLALPLLSLLPRKPPSGPTKPPPKPHQNYPPSTDTITLDAE